MSAGRGRERRESVGEKLRKRATGIEKEREIDGKKDGERERERGFLPPHRTGMFVQSVV